MLLARDSLLSMYPPASTYFSASGIPASASNPNPSPLDKTSALNGSMRNGDGTNSMLGMNLGSREENSGMSVEHSIDSLTGMSNVLLGQQFMEMDRVITLREADFSLDLNSGDWGVS
jgi:hypothetical protein